MFAKPKNQDEFYEKIESMLMLGVVLSVDLETAKAIIQIGDVQTPPIEWITNAGAFTTFAPPSIGEQVLVASLNGDLHNAIIIGGIFSNANPKPNENGDIVAKYSGLTIKIAADGSIDIIAPQIKFTGDLNVTGTINATNDVIGGGKSLKNHRHGLVRAGTEQSGAPL